METLTIFWRKTTGSSIDPLYYVLPLNKKIYSNFCGIRFIVESNVKQVSYAEKKYKWSCVILMAEEVLQDWRYTVFKIAMFQNRDNQF